MKIIKVQGLLLTEEYVDTYIVVDQIVSFYYREEFKETFIIFEGGHRVCAKERPEQIIELIKGATEI